MMGLLAILFKVFSVVVDADAAIADQFLKSIISMPAILLARLRMIRSC